MAWGSVPHKPVSGGLFVGRRRRKSIPLGLLQQRRMSVAAPMQDFLIFTPEMGFNPAYATNLHQRMFVEKPYLRAKDRTVQFEGALYSTSDPGGGAIPDGDATWTEIAATKTGLGHGDLTFYQFQDPDDYIAFDFVGLWSMVWQRPEHWVGPFVVIHELWGNSFRQGLHSEQAYLEEKTPVDQLDEGVRPTYPWKRGRKADGFD